ncbi:hypothetical protein A5653_01440 [Mycobacterium colombiense]|uniref:hypothetical protein n=1 Tax=Mycobacterium colombiense TaxID=339268 RepID=UPI0007FDB066|nr:hypothetical protein [Mycobacterium colombiense]OBJ15082.1 hypothetical protein A9W93_25380 [Mycobacterium colombiense]OBK58874.1 hypothetical protein A5653_01440 [Mycobacterium colombiense]
MNSTRTKKVLKSTAAAAGFVVVMFAPTGCLVSGTTTGGTLGGTTGGTVGGTVGGTIGGIVGGITGALGL